MTTSYKPPLNGIAATSEHDEGAIARCAYCHRYTLDPAALRPAGQQPKCTGCGKTNGWSGSFLKPAPDALWSGEAPAAPVPGEDEQDECLVEPTDYYLSGPITGLADGGAARFRLVEQWLKRHGAQRVVNPHQVTLELVGAVYGSPEYERWVAEHPEGRHGAYCAFLRQDLKKVLGCKAIVMLPGWRTSVGATKELLTALHSGLRYAEWPTERSIDEGGLVFLDSNDDVLMQVAALHVFCIERRASGLPPLISTGADAQQRADLTGEALLQMSGLRREFGTALLNPPPLAPSGANLRQVGGEHYKTAHGLEHWDLVKMFSWDYMQGQIIKYVMRWRKKGGVQDLQKAAHYLEKYIEQEAASPSRTP